MHAIAVRPAALERAARIAGAVTDAAASAAVGRPARLRALPHPARLLRGSLGRVCVEVEDLEVGGLRIARLRVDARDVAVVPAWPPLVRATSVVVRATVDQAALDAWLGGVLPVRLRLGADGLAVRAGVGGLRLAEVHAGIGVEGERLLVTPNRTEVLGLAMGTSALRMPLPLPALPHGTRLVDLVVSDGQATVGLLAPRVQEPLEPERLRRALRLLHG